MALDCKAVHEGYFPSGGMGCVSPVSCFQEHGVEQAHLEHFSSHSIDFHPVSRANAVLAHQYEPSKETHNEIFQSHCKPGACESHHRREIAGLSENDEKDQDDSDRLHCKQDHRPHRLKLTLL